MSRRAGLLGSAKTVTLADVLADMTVIASAGSVSGSQSYASIESTDIPSTETTYMLSFCGGVIGIYKCVNRASTLTTIFRSGTNYGGWAYYNSRYYYSHTAGGSRTRTYGGTIAFVEFPNCSVSDVDSLLGGITGTTLAGTESNAGPVYTADKTHDYVIAGFSGRFDVLPGNDWSDDARISGTQYWATNVTTHSGTEYLFCSTYGMLGESTYGSIIGID